MTPQGIWFAAKAMVTGTLHWQDSDGGEVKDRPGRKVIWRMVKPRVPLSRLPHASCGQCYTGRLRRWKILYYTYGCPQHMPYLPAIEEDDQ